MYEHMAFPSAPHTATIMTSHCDIIIILRLESVLTNYSCGIDKAFYTFLAIHSVFAISATLKMIRIWGTEDM